MYKIAILGCENSHANSFLKYIRDNEAYSDIETLGVYSIDLEAAEKLSALDGERVKYFSGNLEGERARRISFLPGCSSCAHRRDTRIYRSRKSRACR